MLELTRLDDWTLRFTLFLQESQQEGLKCDWEFHHCVSWASLGVEAITGVDFFEPYREVDASTPEKAYKAMLTAGFKSVEDYLSTLFEEKSIAFAQRGDLILAPARSASVLTGEGIPDTEDSPKAPLGFSTAVGFADPPILWALSEEGLGRAPLSTALRCFKVGAN